MPVSGTLFVLLFHTSGVYMNSCVRIHDALLTRLSNDDDLERSLSTFASEMASTAMILGV
jgi:hypothetical protein